MRWVRELSLTLAGVTLAGCDREGRAPTEGVARPLLVGSATAAPPPADPNAPIPPGLGCVPGAHRCVQERLEACEPKAGGFTRVNVCQTSAHCNAKLRQCLVDPCILGEHQCHGADLEQCHGNGWQRVRQCDSPEACDAEAGRCN
jgi:hypothetical protein